MTTVHTSHASVTVWLSNTRSDTLHDGGAIEYVIEIEDGVPTSYTRSTYQNGECVGSHSGHPSAVPNYIRKEVEQHMVPKGAWPTTEDDR